jgi:hypothetical protein
MVFLIQYKERNVGPTFQGPRNTNLNLDNNPDSSRGSIRVTGYESRKSKTQAVGMPSPPAYANACH